MRKTMLAMTAIVSAVCSDGFLGEAAADGAPVLRHSTLLRRICKGPNCGPYAACGARCQTICADGYSCFPLYGAYGPYGGTEYWGAYTFSGWGPR
jgi:hypothetical protein